MDIETIEVFQNGHFGGTTGFPTDVKNMGGALQNLTGGLSQNMGGA